MSETLKSTIVGTIIIGLFMIACTKMATNTVVKLAKATKSYVEFQKAEAKAIVKLEQSKAKDVYLQAAGLSKKK